MPRPARFRPPAWFAATAPSSTTSSNGPPPKPRPKPTIWPPSSTARPPGASPRDTSPGRLRCARFRQGHVQPAHPPLRRLEPLRPLPPLLRRPKPSPKPSRSPKAPASRWPAAASARPSARPASPSASTRSSPSFSAPDARARPALQTPRRGWPSHTNPTGISRNPLKARCRRMFHVEHVPEGRVRSGR